MESFSLLKYLRGGAVAAAPGAAPAAAATTTISASALCEDGGGAGGGDGDDDASFFDLEFAVPGDDSAASDADDERVEFNFAVAAGGEDAVAAPGAAADAVAVDAPAPEAEAVPEALPPPGSLLRPATTRFRVLLLKLRKPKAPPAAADAGAAAQAPRQPPPAVASRFLIKFRVEDAPLASLFTRDSSSRTSDAGGDRPVAAAGAAEPQPELAAASITAEERRFAKEVVLRYLSKIKPLYVKVSRRYGDRLRFGGGGAASEGEETDAEPDPSPDPSSSSSAAAAVVPLTPSPAAQPVVVACGVRAPRASVPAGLKQVCKRLGKSRSASSAVAAAPSPGTAAGAAAGTAGPQAQRRDDSLLQVQDGIQSAIAHCKRSFNASKGSESPLLRSMTAAGGEARAGAAAAVEGA